MDEKSNPKYFVDTCTLLNYTDQLFNSLFRFAISEVTLREIESIKTSIYKDEETKYKARRVTRLLAENQDKYDVLLLSDEIFQMLDNLDLDETPDNLIAMSVEYWFEKINPIDFVTDDLCLYNITTQLLPLKTMLGSEVFGSNEKEIYKGYKELYLDDNKLSCFYEHQTENQFNNVLNEYLIIDDIKSNPIDAYRWTSEGYQHLSNRPIKSEILGTIKPFDIYQSCAFDSLNKNEITVLTGKAGVGKTSIPLYYLQSLLEKGKIKKIYIIYHFETLKNAKTLGYIKGDLDTKILNTSSIGGILASKYGDIVQVQRMMQDGVLEIIPTANIRGIELNDCGLLVTESQDIDTYTLKTILQRCGKNVKCCFEGDILEQSDMNCRSIGLDRMIDVFKGFDQFGYIKLKNNYRNPISSLADKM